ncbi:MAG: DUF1186 domain-containing protein [Endozoicomonas sp.]
MFVDHPLIKPFTELEPDYFPEAELKHAIEHQEEVTPLLLKAFEDYAENPENYDVIEGNFLPAVALALLAQFREAAAFPMFLSVAKDYSCDQPSYDDLIFSMDDEEFGRILASLSRGNIDTLKSLVLDDELEVLMRGYALDALMACYFEGDLERSDFIRFLSGLYTSFTVLEKSSHDDFFLWNALFRVSLTIHPGELMDEIREVCKDGLYSPDQNNLTDVLRFELAESIACKDFDEWRASEWQAQVEDYGYIKNAIRELQYWQMNVEDDWDELPEETMAEISELRAALFEAVEGMGHEPFDASPPFLTDDSLGPLLGTDHPIVREQPKVGRNDLCPCGSGKKFKKCCGR